MNHEPSFWIALNFMLDNMAYPENKMFRDNYNRVRMICDQEISRINRKTDEQVQEND